MPVIAALEMLRQEDHLEFQASLDYKVRPVSKNKESEGKRERRAKREREREQRKATLAWL